MYLVDMTVDNPKSTSAHQRVCERLELSRNLLLEVDSGDVLMGKTRDISPRGALMKADNPPQGDLLNRAATLYIISDEGRFSIGYPCKIVRLEGSFVALEIHKNAAAAFGNYMAKDLLGSR